MTDQEIQALANPLGGAGDAGADIGSALASMMPMIILLTVASIVIMVLYTISLIQKWRTNSAILEIRKILQQIQADGVKLLPVEPNAAAPTPEAPAESTPQPTTPPPSTD